MMSLLRIASNTEKLPLKKIYKIKLWGYMFFIKQTKCSFYKLLGDDLDIILRRIYGIKATDSWE